MNVKVLKVEDAENCRKKLELEISNDEVINKVKELFDELQKSAAIPGFRPGHVPRKILETRYSKKVRAQAIEDLLPTAYDQAVKEQKYDPIGTPYVTDIKADLDQPVQFKVEFEIKPEVKLGEYTGIPVKKKTVEVTDDEVEKVIQNLQNQHATLTPVADRSAKEGDFVNIDFVGRVDGKKFKGGEGKDVQVELGKKQFLPEFENAVVGKDIGSSFVVPVTFPADYHAKDLAGKQANFDISLKEIKEKQLPPIDDELAKDFKFESLAQMKEKIKADSLAHKEDHEKEHLKDQIVEALVSQTELDVPGSMIDHHSRDIFRRNETRLKEYGLTHEQTGTTKEQAEKDSVDAAKKQLKASFILDAIADKEKIVVSDEEVEEAVKNIAVQNRMDPVRYRDILVGQKKLDSLRDQLRDDKVLNLLLEKAKIETDLEKEK